MSFYSMEFLLHRLVAKTHQAIKFVLYRQETVCFLWLQITRPSIDGMLLLAK